MKIGATTQGRDVNPGDPAERRPGLLLEHELRLAVGRHHLDDARAVEEDVDLEAAHVGRPDAIVRRVVGRLWRGRVRAQQRPLLVDARGRSGRPAVLEPVARRLTGGPAPRRRLLDGRVLAVEDGGDARVGLRGGRRGGGGFGRRRLVAGLGAAGGGEDHGGQQDERRKGQHQADDERARRDHVAMRLGDQPAPLDEGAPGLAARQRVLLPADPLAAGLPREDRVEVRLVSGQTDVPEGARHVLIDDLLTLGDAVVRGPGETLGGAQDADLEQRTSGVVPGDGEAVVVGARPHAPPVHVGDDLVRVTHVPPRVAAQVNEPYHAAPDGGSRR